MKKRDWSNIDLDRAYLSHYHTIEVIEEMALENGFVGTSNMESPAPGEYRKTFINIETHKEFSVSTIVYVDTSTYTYIHLPIDGSARDVIPDFCHKLSNADIKRPEDRVRRTREIEGILVTMGFVKSAEINKPTKSSAGNGPVSYKDVDGLYVLDYTGVRGGKILPKKS